MQRAEASASHWTALDWLGWQHAGRAHQTLLSGRAASQADPPLHTAHAALAVAGRASLGGGAGRGTPDGTDPLALSSNRLPLLGTASAKAQLNGAICLALPAAGLAGR